jgi:hypothetical protein
LPEQRLDTLLARTDIPPLGEPHPRNTSSQRLPGETVLCPPERLPLRSTHGVEAHEVAASLLVIQS